MTLYVDASALLKRYVDEPDSDVAVELLDSDPVRATGRHTIVEVRRNLARLLEPTDAVDAREQFETDLDALVSSWTARPARRRPPWPRRSAPARSTPCTWPPPADWARACRC